MLNPCTRYIANGIKTGYPHGFNKGRSWKFYEGSRVRQTPEEDRRTYRPKRCGNNNKDEDNQSKTLKDKNHQASCQKFRQLNSSGVCRTGEELYCVLNYHDQKIRRTLARDIQDHQRAVSTLLGLIRSVYRDLPH